MATCPEAGVVSPADMVAIGDSGANPILNIFSGLYPPHQGSANNAFCDGHVEGAKTNRVYGKTAEARRRWNRDDQPHPETWTD